jgi:glutathione S-transferase
MSPGSPYARMARMAVIELGLSDQVEAAPVVVSPLDTPDALRASNPLGKIPCLTRDDGPALYDSRVILRYLDARAGGRLYPDGERLWATLTLEALAQGIADAGVSISYERRMRPEEKRHQPWVDAQRAKIRAALDRAEQAWISHLSGPFDMGALCLAAATGYLDFRRGFIDVDWREGRPSLAAWRGRVEERACWAATAPE